MGLYPFSIGQVRQTPYILQFIGEGQVYTTFHEFTGVSSGSRYIQITTGARIVHVFNSIYKSAGGGDVQVSYYEGATITPSVTPVSLPPRGFERRIGNSAPALTTITHTPTGISLGSATLIYRTKLYNSGGGQGGSEFNSDNLERILAPNTTYLLEFTVSGGTVDISWNMDFYESEN